MKKVYVGIDVHKDENVFGSAFDGRCKGELIGKCSVDMNRTLTFIRTLMKKSNLSKEQLHICYEAGPTRFVLARHLFKLGFDCQVIAPSKIHERSGDKVKTDRLDACKLARLYRAGEIVAVHIPDVEDKVIRDVCLGRTDAVNEVKRGKQQQMRFLLRSGYRYTGKANGVISIIDFYATNTSKKSDSLINCNDAPCFFNSTAFSTTRTQQEKEQHLVPLLPMTK